MNSQQICRVCLTTEINGLKNPWKSIFETDADDEDNTEISHKLSECAGIIIDKNNNYPHYLCEICYNKLTMFYEFRQICQKSDRLHKMKYEEGTFSGSGSGALTAKTEFLLNDDDTQQIKLDLSPPIHLEDQIKSNTNHQDDDDTFLTDSNSNLKLTRKRNLPTKIVKEGQTKNQKLVYICEVCGNIYNESYKLRRHQDIHVDIFRFECEICHKTFRQNNHLVRHMRSHTGQKPHSCQYCDRAFSDLSSKIKHERFHTGERPYKCNTCEKTFTYSDVLKKHLLVHTGEKPFHCQLCGTSFARKHHLTSHCKSLVHLSRISS